MDSDDFFISTSVNLTSPKRKNEKVMKGYPCKFCHIVFTRKDNLKRHNINVNCERHNSDDGVNVETYNVDDIISQFEDYELEFLSPILWIMNHQEIMTWDKKSGEICYRNCRIHGSNIIELLKCIYEGNFRGIGIVQFCRGLNMLKVPEKYFQHPRMKEILKTLK